MRQRENGEKKEGNKDLCRPIGWEKSRLSAVIGGSLPSVGMIYRLNTSLSGKSTVCINESILIVVGRKGGIEALRSQKRRSTQKDFMHGADCKKLETDY